MNPLFTLMALALGTVAVPATVVTDTDIPALIAGIDMAPKRRCPASPDGR